jgi:antitoxin component YwqK of YwqJK toxin-antitoxin module
MLKTKYLPLLLFFLALSTISLAGIPGTEQDENRRGPDGKKQGRWVYYGKDRPESGIPANGKVEEGNYKDDRKEGIWIKYHDDGVTPKLKGTYVNNRPMGAYTKFHPNGKVREIGYFDKNQNKDSLKRFYENGQLEYEANYASGQEAGKVTYYYANGQKEYEYFANNGKPTGKAIRWYENGNVKEETTFSAAGEVVSQVEKEMVDRPVVVKEPGASNKKPPGIGTPNTQGVKWQPNGYNKVYNSDKEIWQDGVFKEGKLWDGKVYVYDRDGILLKVEVYKGGVYHSDGQL